MMQETGIGIKDPLFFIGVVENNVDGRYEGRVQVRAFGVHGTVEQVATKDLPWAHLIHGSYDPNGNIPPLNSFVFGFFVDGRDAQQPMILGLIPTQMTEIIDPTVSGWGVIPNGKSPARGSEPEDYGQPQNSKLARGENIDETYVLLQQLKRIKNVKNARGVDEEETTWSEPAPEYNTRYPFNRVIETDAHVIELDDTKDYERFMIYHKKNGSFVHIGPSGTTTHKASDDKYEMNEKAQHVYVGGKSNVTIVGDSRVYVQGNKIEEINGDYTQIIRGNHYMGVAGQMNFNSGDEIQLRSAKVRIEANVEGINLKGAKNLRMESGESTHIKSNIGLFLESTNTTNIKAGDNIYLDADSGIIHINANTVNIDDTISMANGDAKSATAATAPEATELPEPPAKGVSTTQHVNTPSKSGGGYVSQDDSTPSEQTQVSDTPAARSITGREITEPIDINKPEVKARLDALRNDPEFMREFEATLKKFPNLTADQLWGTIAGESGGDPTAKNPNGLYAGLFQLGESTGLDPDAITRLSPAEQMSLYRGYLESGNYAGGDLGMYQAAPGVVSNYVRKNNGNLPPNSVLLYIPKQYTDAQIQALQDAGYITDYASREFGNVVLAQNSAGDKTTITPGTVWVESVSEYLQNQGIPGVISVGKVNSYYKKSV